jgi:hypothetical protein
MVSGRRSRQGSGARGCLISLALFTAALYYGINIGEVYLRYYRVLDAMQFQASIAPSVKDEVIERRLMWTADSILGQAPQFDVMRGGSPLRITIQTEYQERVELPLFHHTFVLRPRAEAPL